MTWTAPRPLTSPTRPTNRPRTSHPRRHARLAPLDAAQHLRRSDRRPARSATDPLNRPELLGLVRHMAKVERVWFRKRVAGQDIEHLHNFRGPRRHRLQGPRPRGCT
ncbi:DUF664 domain-containing protein [Aeromicrobium sp. UC242_57]|uniref:mycothiol transferase n=1 Tax=Aeromicrobium sp. UC242_57 TaxID=3374624 RepID=UPI0037A42A42